MLGAETGKYGGIGMGALCLLSVIVLASCNFGGNDAEAADEDKISETFLIEPESFRIATNQTQDVQVFDGTTRYTINSSGTLSFRLQGGGTESLDLESGDVVIERPSVGAVTFIHDVD